MKTKWRARLAILAWLVFGMSVLLTGITTWQAVNAFRGGMTQLIDGQKKALEEARKEALEKPQSEWSGATAVQAALTGATILSTSDEKVYQMAYQAQCRTSDALNAATTKAQSIMAIVSCIFLTLAMLALAKLASVHANGSADDLRRAKMLRLAAYCLWARYPLALGDAILWAVYEVRLGKAMYEIGAPVTGIYVMPQSFQHLSGLFLPEFAGATGLVIGGILFAAAKVLESRGKLEEELEGTV